MIKNSFTYLFSGVLSRAIPFILLPVLTHYLLPKDLGKLAIFQSFMVFLLPFVGMNMHNNISRNFAKYDKSRLAKLIGNLIYVLIFSTLFTFTIVLTFILVSTDPLIFGISKYWLLLIPLVAAFGMLNQFNLTLLRNQERPWSFAKLEISNTGINLGLSLLFIIGLNMTWEGRVLGIISANISFGIIGLIFLFKTGYLINKIDYSEIKEVLYISLPLIPHALGAAIIVTGDRFFLEKMISTEIVGLYLVGSSFGMIVNIFVEAFNRSWSPWVYKMLNADNPDAQSIVKYSYILFVSYLLLALIVTGISHVILPYMVASEYQEASQFIIWIAVSYAFRGMYTIVFPYFVYSKSTYYLGGITGLTALVSIALNFILISMNGAIGAAQALFFSWLIQFLLTWAFSYKVYKMPWFRFNK